MHLVMFLTVLVGGAHWTSACDIQERGVSDAAKKAILKKHNELRAKVANGKQKGLPSAADMLEMEWDDHLARQAQKWAEQCVYDHDDAKDKNGDEAGQNIGWEGKSDTGADWDGMIQSWFDEVKNFKASDIGKYPADEIEDEDKEIGHFTQVVWAKTNKVGCGYIRYREGGSNEFLYGCNYSPAGNVENRPIYKVGKPCSGCGGCGSIAGLCKAH